jgi:hypothetical protein
MVKNIRIMALDACKPFADAPPGMRWCRVAWYRAFLVHGKDV